MAELLFSIFAGHYMHGIYVGQYIGRMSQCLKPGNVSIFFRRYFVILNVAKLTHMRKCPRLNITVKTMFCPAKIEFIIVTI